MEDYKKYFWLLIDLFVAAAFVVMVFVWAPSVARQADSLYSARNINVSAEGKTTVSPDLAITTLSVVSRGQDPKKIASENNKKMSDLIEKIKDLGVEDKDIKTSEYNLSPEYRWDDINQKQLITGYTMTQSVVVKIRDLNKTAEVLSVAAEMGSNQMSGVTFTVEDQDKYLTEAREKALANAKAKAEQMASKTGAKLGRVMSVSEYFNNPVPMYGAYGMGGEKMMRSDMAAVAAPTIQPGSQEVSLTVNVTYELE